MARIKICGLRRAADIDYVNEFHPDYVGFVLWPKSRRAVTAEEAAALRARLLPGLPAVGVFVDQPLEEILTAFQLGAIDIAQLHGHETPEDIRTLQQAGGKPVWKAFQVRSETDLAAAENSPADLVLLDNGYGTGRSFDWSLLSRPLHRPWLLAGGLTPENIPEALRRFSPTGVDLSSGVETGGWKDREKIQAAVQAARAYYTKID